MFPTPRMKSWLAYLLLTFLVGKWAAKGLHREREVVLGRIGPMRNKKAALGSPEPRFGRHLGVLRVDARGLR